MRAHLAQALDVIASEAGDEDTAADGPKRARAPAGE
jgi:hypothetical protein